jgi:hypothetical protein
MNLIIVIGVLGFWALIRTIKKVKEENDVAFMNYNYGNWDLPSFIFYPIVFVCELAKAIILPSLIFLAIYLHWFC